MPAAPFRLSFGNARLDFCSPGWRNCKDVRLPRILRKRRLPARLRAAFLDIEASGEKTCHGSRRRRCGPLLSALRQCRWQGDGLSLFDTIEQTAERLARDLPPGTRVAIVAFESESDSLSEFIMDELAGALLDSGIEVADRRNLYFVSRELGLSLGGSVSDESALSIGRMQAAQVVITGHMRNIGQTRRFTAGAVHVEP